MSSLATSVLDGIGVGEDTVLVVSLIVGFSWSSWLSLLWFGLRSSLELPFPVLDVLESLSESVLDGHDLCRSLVKEIVDLRLYLGVGLIVILLKLDLGDSLLDLSDQVSESLLGGLAFLLGGVDLLRLLGSLLLSLGLLECDLLLLDGRLPGLLFTSHLVDLGRLLVELLVEHLDDLLLIMLVDELDQALDHGVGHLVRQLLD